MNIIEIGKTEDGCTEKMLRVALILKSHGWRDNLSSSSAELV